MKQIDLVRVIFEDEWLVVVDKPPGVVVNRAESVKGETVQDWMITRIKNQQTINKNYTREEKLFWSRGGVVHRLDKDTSGVMALAKKPGVMVDLMKQFKQREVTKEYVALVHGKLVPRAASLRVPVARTKKDRAKFGVVVGGKMTETDYRVVDYIEGEENYSLVELMPKTGRTHQLRVVLRHLSHPIVGDEKYLSKKRAKRDRGWCPRQFLHAKKLCFNHSVDGNRVCFEAELARDLRLAMKQIRNKASSD